MTLGSLVGNTSAGCWGALEEHGWARRNGWEGLWERSMETLSTPRGGELQMRWKEGLLQVCHNKDKGNVCSDRDESVRFHLRLYQVLDSPVNKAAVWGGASACRLLQDWEWATLGRSQGMMRGHWKLPIQTYGKHPLGSYYSLALANSSFTFLCTLPQEAVWSSFSLTKPNLDLPSTRSILNENILL